ncbi:MAG: DUF3042 family protein [Lactobacillaceae bacterium]|jgi:hypothetical protein|nr:DUF3042 family protein [Lactobacillaceae bacterium]
MKKFGWGVVTGVAATAVAAAASLFTFHKVVVEPDEKLEAKFDETDIKSARKAGSSHTPRF